MSALPPTITAHLFRPLAAELVALLRSLTDAEWNAPTVAGAWRVRDVAAHLLDGDLRRIAAARDGHLPPHPVPPADGRGLAAFINALNASGVAYATRLSPRLISDLLEVTAAWVAHLIESRPPDAPAVFPVSWAGQDTSPHWMDAGREYTERWHHQMQIRAAVSRPLLLEPRWLRPVLDMSVRAIPPAYAGLDAPVGTTVVLQVEGETTASWTLERTSSGWSIGSGPAPRPAVVVSLSSDDAWRLFYNALPGHAIARRVRIDGHAALAEPLLRTRAIII